MFSQDALYHYLDFGAGAWKARPLLSIRYGAESPVDGDAFANLGDQLGGDDFWLIVAERFDPGKTGCLFGIRYGRARGLTRLLGAQESAQGQPARGRSFAPHIMGRVGNRHATAIWEPHG